MQERGSRSRIYSSSILILEIVSALKNIFQRRKITRGISVDTFRKITFSIPLPIRFLRGEKKASGAIRLEGKYFRLWNLWCHESSLKRSPYLSLLPLQPPPPESVSRLRRQIFFRVYFAAKHCYRFAASILFITSFIHYVTMDSEGSEWYFIKQREREIDHHRVGET